MFAFDYVYESDKTTEIQYNPEWANGTGYLNGVVGADLGLAPGQMVRAIDEHGRRMVINGTPFGNLVVFERYSGNSDTLVCNSPHLVERATGTNGILNEDKVDLLIGIYNIGRTLAEVQRTVLVRDRVARKNAQDTAVAFDNVDD